MFDSMQRLSKEFIKEHPVDAARILEQLATDDIVKFLIDFSPDLAAKVSIFMPPLMASKCLGNLDNKNAAAIIEKLTVEVATVLLRRVEESKRLAILEVLPDDIMKLLSLVLKYPENTAGALMDPQVFTLFDDISVKEAIKDIRINPEHVFYHIPVINREQAFLGLINIRELMISEPESRVASVMHTGIGSLSPNANRETILAHPDWRIYHELPVVDQTGIFLGLISYQVVRRLENEVQKSIRSAPLADAGKALGELYWVGLSAFLKGAASVMNPEKK
jgi:magnesium transporter